MDFHAAMETFAEAWVAANTQTAVNTEGQMVKQTSVEDLPTQLPKQQLLVTTTTPTKQPPPEPQPDSPTSASSTKSLPIHCIIEQTSGPPSFDQTGDDPTSTHTTVELDSYAILPGTTLLSECVHAALIKLGYTSVETMGAKGAIQIKNWKPLNFESIAESKSANIDDILGELTQVATLRIRICSEPETQFPRTWTDQMVRCVVQDLLKEMNQSTLSKLSPLSQSAISNIANWKYSSVMSTDKCQEFGDWFKQYKLHHRDNEFKTEQSSKDSRLTFHPEHEIPQMRSWYKAYKNPSETKLQFFASELNKGHVRQERPKVTIERLKNWWKNERQRLKRLKDRKRYEMVEDKSMGETMLEKLATQESNTNLSKPNINTNLKLVRSRLDKRSHPVTRSVLSVATTAESAPCPHPTTGSQQAMGNMSSAATTAKKYPYSHTASARSQSVVGNISSAATTAVGVACPHTANSGGVRSCDTCSSNHGNTTTSAHGQPWQRVMLVGEDAADPHPRGFVSLLREDIVPPRSQNVPEGSVMSPVEQTVLQYPDEESAVSQDYGEWTG